MVNNWAMELQQFTIEFEHIEGIKNTLADTMSRLVHITPGIEKEPELPDQEFGKYVFEKLDPVLVQTVFGVDAETEETEPQIEEKSVSTQPIPQDQEVKWPVTLDQLRHYK